MSIRILALVVVLLIAAGALESAKLQESTQKSQRDVEANVPGWPNLDRLENPRCDLKGFTGGDREKEARNLFRNRYRLPKDGFEEASLQALRDIPQGKAAGRKLTGLPTSADCNHRTAVSVVAYVLEVTILTCGAVVEKCDEKTQTCTVTEVPQLRRKGVESANCNNADERYCTTQIFVTSDPDSHDNGRNVYILNVPRRSRELMARSLLSSNIGIDWSTDKLRKLKGKWVRFSGWLYFNENYGDRAWVSDPDNKIGKRNDRETSWSLYPVMGIESDVSPPPAQTKAIKRCE